MTLTDLLDELQDVKPDEARDLLAYIAGRDPELLAKILKYRDERRENFAR